MKSSKIAVQRVLRREQKPATISAAHPSRRDASDISVIYDSLAGVDDWVERMDMATPMQRIAVERSGVPAVLFLDLAQRMRIPAQQVCSMLGVPRASVARKAASGAMITGSAGRAALGMARMLGTARAVVANSTAREAKGFDHAVWLGQWLELPQAALGGVKPSAIIDTPTGVAVVAKLIGSLESGAYQ